MSKPICEELNPDQWQRLRNLRLASLLDSPDAFGGSFEKESAMSEADWRALFDKNAYLVASKDGEDIAMTFVENLKGDFGATCWIGGCWTDPRFRGSGALRVIFDYLDERAAQRGWQVQGLGVFVANKYAIAAYERLGFVAMGEPQESTRKPGNFYQRMIRGL